MLEKILAHLNNWFIVPGGIHHGSYSVEGGEISLPFLQDGQFFRVMGSVFNDGLYQYPAANLTDEQFDGTIWALAIPKRVMELSEEIAAWNSKQGDGVYTSESFDGYSYTKATDGKGQPLTWEGHFRRELNEWRKARCFF